MSYEDSDLWREDFPYTKKKSKPMTEEEKRKDQEDFIDRCSESMRRRRQEEKDYEDFLEHWR